MNELTPILSIHIDVFKEPAKNTPKIIYKPISNTLKHPTNPQKTLITPKTKLNPSFSLPLLEYSHPN